MLFVVALCFPACSVNRLAPQGQCEGDELLVGFSAEGEPLCSSFQPAGVSAGEGLLLDPITRVLSFDVAGRALPDRYRSGLEITTNGSGIVTVAAGRARDSTDTLNLELATSAVADRSKKDDRDIPSQADGWNWIWLIGDSTDVAVTRPFISEKETMPNYPTGYDSGRLIGAAYYETVGYRPSRQVMSGNAVQVFQIEKELSADATWSAESRNLDALFVVPPGTLLMTATVQIDGAASADVHFIDELTGVDFVAIAATAGARAQVTAPVNNNIVRVSHDGASDVDMNIACLGYEWGPQEPR